MAKNPDPALKLTTSQGVTRTLDDWSTMFHLFLVVLPARSEAASYVPIGMRLFQVFGDADCRFAFVVTGPESVAKRMLGDAESTVVTYVDPDLELVKSLGLERLPACVLLRQDTSLVTAAEGWDPREWQRVTREASELTAWTTPEVASEGDPPAFQGWPVL
ncbi:MAG: hypothetical protein FJW86_01670 [Actinobacteria bacterium]|nr:hypothetical protein [Actinomycetota bacterium]